MGKNYLKMSGIIALFAIILVANSQTVSNNGNATFSAESVSFNGMKHIVLQKQNTNSTNQAFLGQEDFRDDNTIYVIRSDFKLTRNVVIPQGCILQFDGGSISGKYTLTGTNTSVDASLVRIFGEDVNIEGAWNVPTSYPEWFGAKGDGITDDAGAIQKAFSLNCPVYLQNKIYGVKKSIRLVEATTITGCSSESNVNPGSVSKSTQDYKAPSGCVKALASINSVFLIDGISVAIKNIAIDGNNKLAYSGIGQDRKNYKSRILIDNCDIYNCKYGISTALYLSEISNTTCHQCEVGFHNESGTGATMTSLSFTRNFSKNCKTGYHLVGLIYSNMLNNACDRCENGVILKRVRCCNFISNGFEIVKNVYTLSDYCDALEFNGVYGGALENGAKMFFTDSSFYGKFSIKDVKLLILSKIESLLYITGNPESSRHCIVHIDNSVNKFLCKGSGNYSIVENEKNLLKSMNFVPFSENTENINRIGNKHLYEIGNGSYFIEGFSASKGSRTKLIYELSEITLEPGEYLFGGFIISDNDIDEKISCVISKGRFTNNTIATTRHGVGAFILKEKTKIYMSLYLNRTAKVPDLLIAPYITKVN